MKQRGLVILTVFAAVALVATLLSATLTQGAGPKERIVFFTNGDPAVNQQAKDDIERHGGTIHAHLIIQRGLDILAVELPAEAAAGISNNPGVLGFSRDLRASQLCHNGGPDPKGCEPTEPTPTPTPTPEPAPAGEQLVWGVDRIDADMVWSTDGQPGIGASRSVDVAAEATITGGGVIVAVMDSGVDFDHPDLAANLDINGDGLVNSDDGHVSCVSGVCSGSAGAGGDAIDDHGSHVAGIVAAVDNDIGVIGTAPRAKLLSINIFDGGGAFFSDVIAGYQYLVIKDSDGNIVGRRADVVNQSFGYSKSLETQCPSCVTALQSVVNDFWAAGGVLIAAAGNDGNPPGNGDNVSYPARLQNEVAVGATNTNDSRASFSSTGPDLDLMAPGVSILSTVNGGGYNSFSGTSMASPHVAGSAALVIHALGSGWGNAAVVDALIGTADDLGKAGFDTKYGYGLVDTQEAATGTASTP
jgi:subtilisin family serine protease